MKRKYYIGTLLALIVIIVNQAYIQYQLYQKHQDAKVINVAGRQRMLSQKLTYEMTMAKTDETYLSRSQKTLYEWQKGHNALLNGDSDINVEAIRSNEAIDALYDISQNINTAENYLLQINQISTDQIEQNQNSFLAKMEKAVALLEIDANRKLRYIVIIELLLAALAIMVLLAEYFFVYRPAAKEMEYMNRKLTEQANLFRGIYDSNTAINIVMDLDLNIIEYNREAEIRMMEYRGQNLNLHKSFKDLVVPGTEEHFKTSYARAIQGKISNADWPMPTIDGDIRWMSATYYPVYEDQGKIIGVAFNCIDIHEKKIAESKARKQEEKIKEINQIQSHDIRGPLSKIMSIVEVIKMEDDDQAKIEMISYLDDAAEELDEVIHRIVLSDQPSNHKKA